MTIVQASMTCETCDRDDVLHKLDEVMGKLSQMREDQIFMNRDIRNHEERITKLETAKAI